MNRPAVSGAVSLQAAFGPLMSLSNVGQRYQNSAQRPWTIPNIRRPFAVFSVVRITGWAELASRPCLGYHSGAVFESAQE